MESMEEVLQKLWDNEMAKYSLILDTKAQVQAMVKYHVGDEKKAVKTIGILVELKNGINGESQIDCYSKRDGNGKKNLK